jgi:hypothetical protein
LCYVLKKLKEEFSKKIRKVLKIRGGKEKEIENQN